jgi:hypothetical protein
VLMSRTTEAPRPAYCRMDGELTYVVGSIHQATAWRLGHVRAVLG